MASEVLAESKSVRRPSRLPVFYVFPKRRSASSNASEMAARFAAAYAEWTSAHAEEGSHISRAMLFYDISYHWMIGAQM